MRSVGQAADPQTDAAIKIVAWLTHSALKPTGDDFAMLRLVLRSIHEMNHARSIPSPSSSIPTNPMPQ